MQLLRFLIIYFLIQSTLFSLNTFSQDLEPRRWTPLPLDMQVIGVGYGLASGDIDFDPVTQIEDVEFKLNVVGASYVTSFKIADKLARFDVTVPWASGKWQGLVESKPTEVKRVGLLDPTFRVSINLLGSPALKANKLIPYLKAKKSNTILGVALSVKAPLGEYNSEKLINLGQNKYVIRPQVGLVHTRENWSYELTGSVFVYTDNNEFYDEKTLEQAPLYTIQGHIIRSLNAGKWISVSAGYGLGAPSKLDGKSKNDKRNTFLSALSFGMPISRTQSVKLAYIYQQSNSLIGVDSSAFAFAWSKHF